MDRNAVVGCIGLWKSQLVEPKDVGETLSLSSGVFEVTVTGDEPEATFTGIESKGMTKVVIPDTVTVGGVTYTVTSVSVDAFKNNKKLKSVTIGRNVEEIENGAFSGCSALSKLTIRAKELESIGDNAFANCYKLTSVTIPEGVEKIGKNAFAGCKKLKKIIKNAFKGIKRNATFKCPKKQYSKYKKLLKKSKISKTVKIK